MCVPACMHQVSERDRKRETLQIIIAASCSAWLGSVISKSHHRTPFSSDIDSLIVFMFRRFSEQATNILHNANMSLAPSADQKAQVASQAQACCTMVPPVGVLSGVPTVAASEAHLRMVELGEIQCSSKVYALRWDQKPILLDLTPGQDDWVQLGREFDQRLLKRAETTNVKLLLELPSTTIQDLERMDACIWEQCRNTFPAVKYMPMVHNDQKVLVSMVVDGSAPFTQLHF